MKRLATQKMKRLKEDIEKYCEALQNISQMHGKYGTEKYGKNNYKECAQAIFKRIEELINV